MQKIQGDKLADHARSMVADRVAKHSKTGFSGRTEFVIEWKNGSPTYVTIHDALTMKVLTNDRDRHRI